MPRYSGAFYLRSGKTKIPKKPASAQRTPVWSLARSANLFSKLYDRILRACRNADPPLRRDMPLPTFDWQIRSPEEFHKEPKSCNRAERNMIEKVYYSVDYDVF